MLNDMLNLEILRNICSGNGVSVNVNALAKKFKKHRNTIKSEIKEIFDNHLINKPIYPFMWLYQEYPLMVVVRADFPRNESIDKFMREDEHIFASFYVRDEEYNTLMIEYHKDMYSYGEWRNQIVKENRIPPREYRYPSDTVFFSNKHFIKYQPYSPIYNFEKKLQEGKDVVFNGCKVSALCFKIIKSLMLGEGIRTNENLLSQTMGVHRRTIEHRISGLLREKIVGVPVCRFPKFFVPPNQILIYCLIEIKKSREKFLNAIKFDPNVPLAIEANVGRYNLLLFKVFFSVEEYFEWEVMYEQRFPDSIGAMKKIFLSPQMTATIDQQKVSLGIIRNRMEMLRGKELIETISA